MIRDANEKKFRTTRRLRAMALGLLNMSHVHIAGHQNLKNVAANTKEMLNYVVRQENGSHYLDRVKQIVHFVCSCRADRMCRIIALQVVKSLCQALKKPSALVF